MINNIQEVTAFRIIIEREKLAQDEKSVQLIFEILEKYGIPCECLTIHIDSLTIVVRNSEYEKCSRCLDILEQRLSRMSISLDRDVVLLCIERQQITCRDIGMIISSLTMQNIEIKMHRYFQCQGHFIIGVPMTMVEKARGIVTEIIDANYQI